MQSIEDLISGHDAEGDTGVQARFQAKQAEIKLKEKERETQVRAAAAGLSYVYLVGFPISPEALVLISEDEARQSSTLCFFYDGEHIRLATTRPGHVVEALAERLSKEYFCETGIYLVSPHSFDNAVKLYATLPKVRKFVDGVEIKTDDLKRFEAELKDFRRLQERIVGASISDLVTMILASAFASRASDVHIEAEETGIVVRLRVDGVLQEAATIAREEWKKTISRLKLLARVKINVVGKPQDGRFTIHLDDQKVEVRVSFLPTAFGESVVMRLLRADSIQLSLADLGLSPAALVKMEKEISKPNGMILTTGPTGSGKTTTLYAILNKLNDSGSKIVTLEDPIEYRLEGVNQSQVDVSKNYTFAAGLRSVLRQDPDIVMVGEIRDLETAEIAVQASLTGHLVLSTLHTNDASGVLPRLTDLGVKPYFIVPAVNAVLGQRLVRKLCPHCRQSDVLDEARAEQVKKIMATISPKSGESVPTELPQFFRAGAGCDYCHGLGYKGRVGIYEVMTMSDQVKSLASEDAPAFRILQAAIEDGMLTMLQDGVLKAGMGLTDLDEVYRVIGKFDYVDELYDIAISKTLGRGLKIVPAVLERASSYTASLTSGIDLSGESAHDALALALAVAIRVEAGDVHIEPGNEDVKIRFRIDGVLHDAATLSKDHFLPLMSILKNLANMPASVKKATWDGRFSLYVGDRRDDCRISIISGAYGETAVIRLLTEQAGELSLSDLGMKPYTLEVVMRALESNRGMIVTSGPTGSGKTTTLYAALNHINRPDSKIITIEDPIEYHLDGVMQTQVDVTGGYTFAAALRSLLRQNPNVIMLGEVRDPETASTAVEAAMTGHLVLTTVHANSAAGAAYRLASLAQSRANVADSIEMAIGQRLVRRLCPHCRQLASTESPYYKEAVNILHNLPDSISDRVANAEQITFYESRGCAQCNGLGYRGRLGVYEALYFTPGMRQALAKPDSIEADLIAATYFAMPSLIQDALLKALDGETTLEEVFKIAR